MISTGTKERLTVISYDALRGSSEVPRVHPNGFLQLNLDGTGFWRLHVWSDELPKPRVAVPTPIHDHIYDFTSKVILGSLRHLVYELEEDPEGSYDLYDVWAQSTKKDAPLERMDNSRYTARLIEASEIMAGDGYSFERFRFHESESAGLTATLFSTSDFDPTNRPRILCPTGKTPSNTFRRDSLELEFLWRIIEEVCSQILKGGSR